MSDKFSNPTSKAFGTNRERKSSILFHVMPSRKNKETKRATMSSQNLSERATKDAFHGIIQIYGDKHGDQLLGIAEKLDNLWMKMEGEKMEKLNINKPRQKVNVLFVGNHSAGKSSFINWYVGGKPVCAESQAQETRSYCFVTYGKKEMDVVGESTLMKFDYIKNITDKFDETISNYMRTSVVDRDSNAFKFVDLIDSPGLVGAAREGQSGGNVQKYEFDIDNSLMYIAERCDLVYVFLDNHGGATQMRTIEVYKKLINLAREKKCFELHTFLTKIDQVQSTKDLMNLHGSIQSELSENVKQNSPSDGHQDLGFAFRLKNLFVPNEQRLKMVDPEIKKMNDIEEANRIIVEAIKAKVSKNFEILKHDCKKLGDRRAALVEINKAHVAKRDFRATLSSVIYVGAFSIAVYMFICVAIGIRSYLPKNIAESAVYEILVEAAKPLVASYADHSYFENTKVALVLFFTFYVLCFLARMLKTRASLYPIFSSDDKNFVQDVDNRVNAFLEEKERLHRSYLEDPVDDIKR